MTLVNDNSKWTQGDAVGWTLIFTQCMCRVSSSSLFVGQGLRLISMLAKAGILCQIQGSRREYACRRIERLLNHTHVSLKHPSPAVYGKSTSNSQISIHTKAPVLAS